MSEEKIHVFIDEFGNAHLDLSKEGTPSHFVYAAVIINENDLQKARNIRDSISNKYNQNAPLKSSKLKNDDKGFKKRLNYLKEFKALNFLIVCLVVNKSKLDPNSGGLKYHDVFYKFFNRILLAPISKNYDSLYIHVDQLGYDEFQQSLKEYINKKVFQLTLFEKEKQYEFVEDKTEEPLIQYADIIAGSLGKIYCTNKSDSRSGEILDLLHERLIIDFFPYENLDYFIPIGNNTFSSYDDKIPQIAVQSALNVIENKGKLSEEAIEVVKFLLLMFKSSPTKLIEAYDIVERVRISFPTFDINSLRNCIQDLRDEEVLIASIEGKKGYKIPNRIQDILGFYNRYLNSIVPMIDRIEICDRILKYNNIDVLNDNIDLKIIPELLKLRKK